MKDITKEKYAEWLENSVKAIAEGDAKSILLAAKLGNGEVVTGYYECGLEDKAMLLAHIQADMTMSIVQNNADMVKKAIDDLDDDGGGL